MALPAQTEHATGRVVSVNPKGIKLDGADGWLNFSKFAPDIVPPMKGQTVSVTLDKSGFIRAVDVIDGAAPTQLHAPSVKDQTITRLAILKAAAEFAASKPEAKSTDVLKIAAAWEEWVLRD